MTSDSCTSRPARASVWLVDRSPGRRRGARGDEEQPSGLDRERITVASVRLLDADGLPAFSMRRLAAELSVTAMSLYWYVDSKDDLLELALDAVHGELELPSTTGDDWRDQLRRVATGYRALLLRHPWVSPLLGQYLNLGPRALAFARAAEHVTARSGLSPERLPGGLAALFQFVHGFGAVEANWTEHCRRAGTSPDEYVEAIQAQLGNRPVDAGPGLRQPGGTGGPGGPGGTEELRDRDFSVGLDCVLSGIEALRDRAAGAAPPSSHRETQDHLRAQS